MYGIFTSIFFFFANAAVVVALYVLRELRLAAYRDRIAVACTVCTSWYAKYRVRAACTSLLITGDQGDKIKNKVSISEMFYFILSFLFSFISFSFILLCYSLFNPPVTIFFPSFFSSVIFFLSFHFSYYLSLLFVFILSYQSLYHSYQDCPIDLNIWHSVPFHDHDIVPPTISWPVR